MALMDTSPGLPDELRRAVVRIIEQEIRRLSMSEDKNQNDKEDLLYVNVSDGIYVSDVVDVQLSDITITARREDGEEQNITIPREVPSDAIAQSVSDALSIPEEASAPFQELIIEEIEHVKREPWEAKLDISLPLHKLHPRLPDLKLVSLQVKSGQRITAKKYTMKQLPKDN